jgi:hypothetical protein
LNFYVEPELLGMGQGMSLLMGFDKHLIVEGCIKYLKWVQIFNSFDVELKDIVRQLLLEL